jgi:hypothetical protein
MRSAPPVAVPATKHGEVWRWISVDSVYMCIYIHTSFNVHMYSFSIYTHIYIYVCICTYVIYIYVYDVVEINFDQLGCNWCSSEVPMMSCPKMGENSGIQ